MNKEKLIEQAQELLKAAKENPEQFQSLAKDDAAHAPNTPEDKAHDVAEHADTMNHAMKILDTPEKQKAMLDHLRTLHEPQEQRSPENAEAGQAPQEQAMDKSELIKAAKQLIELAKTEPAKFEEMAKAMAAPAPAPAMAKPAAPKMPKPAAMQAKPAGAQRMSKEEIMADCKKEWTPKFRKAK